MPTTTTNPGNYVVENQSTKTSTAKIKQLMIEHLEEYVQFYGVCIAKPSIDKDEIPMLWQTWCIRKGRQ